MFGALVAAGFGFPIPEELPVIGGGALAAHASTQVPREHPYWYILWPVCILGVVVSDGVLYGDRPVRRQAIARHADHAAVHSPREACGNRSQLPQVRHHGASGARFLPGIRAGVFVTAGILRMPFVKFLIADGIYAIPGVSLLFFMSFWFTDSFKALYNRVHGQIEALLPLIVVIVIAAVGITYLLSYLRRRVETGNPTEVPIISTVVKEIEEAAEGSERMLPSLWRIVMRPQLKHKPALTIPRDVYDAILAQKSCRASERMLRPARGGQRRHGESSFPVSQLCGEPGAIRIIAGEHACRDEENPRREIGRRGGVSLASIHAADAEPDRSGIELRFRGGNIDHLAGVRSTGGFGLEFGHRSAD